MNQNPWLLIILILGGLWIGWMWIRDLRQPPAPGGNKPLPGATLWQAPLIWFAVVVGLALVGIETAGESWLGLTAQQTIVQGDFLSFIPTSKKRRLDLASRLMLFNRIPSNLCAKYGSAFNVSR